MGSHIDGFFPHCSERSPEAVLARLNGVFGRLGEELALVASRGRFSRGGSGWSLWYEGGAISGEGSSGFSASVYPAVVRFTSPERFGAIQRPDQGIDAALRRVFEEVAAGFGAGGRLAVAAGGFGDTDQAGDLALAGAGFPEVCANLGLVIGPPARSWAALGAGAGLWYLSDPESMTWGPANRGGSR